jgi:hypothetical protein
MGRILSPVAASLSSQKVIARHLTLRIDWPQGVTTRWAGTKALIGGDFYDNRLISSTPLEQTQGRPADRVDITAVNRNWDVTTLNRTAAIPDIWVRKTTAIVGRLLRDAHANSTDEWTWVQLFEGEVVAIQTFQESATLSIVSDIYAAPLVGATEILAKTCRFIYRDSDTCTYDGPLPLCTHLLEGPNGCIEHFNKIHFGGSNLDTAADTLVTPPPSTSGGTGGPGGTDSGGNPDPGDGRGRIFDPAILETY